MSFRRGGPRRRSAASATSSAGSARTRSGGEETDICIRIGQSRRPGHHPLRPGGCGRPRRSARQGGVLVLPGALRRRGALEGRALEPGREPVRPRDRARLVRRTLPMGFIRGLRRRPARGPGRAGAGSRHRGRPADDDGGVRLRTGGQLRRPPRVRGPGSRRPAQGARLMVTPRNPLGQGGVERHVMEVSRRVAAAGAEIEVLCAEPGGRECAIRAPGRRADPLGPRLAGEAATTTSPAALARDRERALERRPRPVLPHAGGPAGDAAGAFPRHSLRGHLPRRRALIGNPQPPAPTAAPALRPLLARAERLVAVARFEVDQYSRELRLPREKFVLIPNGTDLEFDAARTPAPPGAPPCSRRSGGSSATRAITG